MERPRVIVGGTVSVDGRLTLAPGVLLMFGDERWQAVAGESDIMRRLMMLHQPQAFFGGSASLVPDEAGATPLPEYEGDPTPLYSDFLPEAVVNRPGHRGWFTVVDTRGRIHWAYKEWPSEEMAGWHLLVVVSHATPASYLAYLQAETIPYLVAGKERADLRLELEQLHGAMLRAGLVDEVSVEFFPALIGGFRTSTLFDSSELAPDEWPTRLELMSAEVQAGGHVWLRYLVLGIASPATAS